MVKYKRLSDENYDDYWWRICSNKDLGIYDLTWGEVAEILNQELCEDFSSSKWRKNYQMMRKGFDKARKESIETDEILDEIELKKIEFEKEKQRFFDQRVAYRKLIRENARYDELKNIIGNTIKNIKPYELINDNIENCINISDNDLLVGLNDVHYGVEIDNYWNKYNPEIAKERLEKYILEIISIKELHQSENCYICANGDLISGNIHYKIALANRENVVKQVMGVSELIAWFISELSPHFKKVHFSVVAGNHSRLSTKRDSPKDERLDDLIPFYIKARLQNLSNVIIKDNNIDNTMDLVNIRGLNYAMVHGDMDSVNGVLKLIEMLPEKVYAVVMGHIHHNSLTSLQGYKIISSGSLMGVDDYCIEKRILGKPEQSVLVCTDRGVKCIYDIILEV